MNTKNKKTTLSGRAYAYVKQEIITGSLRANDIITESSIAQILEMSRTPVKKALTQLEVEGYVKCIDGVGTMILGLSIVDLADIYEVRTAMETLALRTAIHRISQEEIDEVRNRLLDIQKGYQEGRRYEPEYISQADEQFHRLLIEHTGNNYVKSLMDSIQSRIERYRYQAYQMTDTGKESSEQHLAILTEIEKKDYEKAKEKLQNHIQWSFETLRDAFSTLYIG